MAPAPKVGVSVQIVKHGVQRSEMNGQSQTVRLPKAFRLPGHEVYTKKVGNAVVLIPMDHPWDNLYESLTQFSADFMQEREQPAVQVRKGIFS